MRFLPLKAGLVPRLVACLAVLPMAAGGVRAQTITLDEGAFRLFVGDREVGTETFSIRQSGNGANATIVARGRVLMNEAAGAEEVTATLEVARGGLRPGAYEITVRGSEPQRIAGQLVGSRFSAKILSPTGEMMREYLASDGAVLVDRGVVHHYYFLAQRFDGDAFRVPLIVPRESRQVSAQVTPRGAETVDVAGQTVDARHVVVEPAGGNARHLWVDEGGRVLQLEIPAREFAARRVSMPG